MLDVLGFPGIGYPIRCASIPLGKKSIASWLGNAATATIEDIRACEEPSPEAQSERTPAGVKGGPFSGEPIRLWIDLAGGAGSVRARSASIHALIVDIHIHAFLYPYSVRLSRPRLCLTWQTYREPCRSCAVPIGQRRPDVRAIQKHHLVNFFRIRLSSIRSRKKHDARIEDSAS